MPIRPERRPGWTVHWNDCETGERCSEYVGMKKSAPLRAFRAQIPSNDYGMRVVRATDNQPPEFIVMNGREHIGVVLT